MTTYTADDFKNARFAEHPASGRIAARLRANKMWAWTAGRNEDRLRDDEMVDGGWVPVPAGSYTRTDEEADPRETVEFWKGAANAAKRRAEKAEKERDDLRAQIEADSDVNYLLREDRDAWKAKATPPRPLTPDAISGEMVRRAHAALVAQTGHPHAVATVEAVLTAALTEPPARPEGAEAVAVRLFQAGAAVGVEMTEEQRDALADHLAAMHVRVVGEER